MVTDAIARLRSLMDKATRGPWSDDGRGTVSSPHLIAVDVLDESKGSRIRRICKCGDGDGIFSCTPRDWSNAAPIAAAVNALPDLVAVAENIGLTEGISGPSGIYFLDRDAIIAAVSRLREVK